MFKCFVFILLFNSCAIIEFKHSGKLPYSTNPVVKSEKRRSVEGVKDFYLFGLLPEKHVVYTDKELSKRGLLVVKKLKTTSYITSWQFFKSMLSFGLYIPMTYKITASGPVR